MNTGISRGFGIVLNILHIVTMLVLIFLTSVGSVGFLVAIAAGIGYLFIVGLACTLIAIREHLETLIEMNRKPAATPEPAVIRRREGVLNV